MATPGDAASFPVRPRIQGATAVRAVWEEFFTSSAKALLETEVLKACRDACGFWWLCRWVGPEPDHVVLSKGHIKG